MATGRRSMSLPVWRWRAIQMEPARRRSAMEGGGGRRTRSAGEARQGAASPPRRRSERLASTPAPTTSQEKPSSEAGKEPPTLLCPRPITLKKIRPRNLQQVKRTPVTRSQSPRISQKEEKENVVPEANSPGMGNAGAKQEPNPLHCSTLDPLVGKPQEGSTVLSPVSINVQESPTGDQRDLAMAKRVRRSYSRLEISFASSFLEGSRSPSSNPAGTSTPNCGPDKRHTLFGFEKLLLPDEVARASPRNADTPLKAAEMVRDPDLLLEPDTNIPGIAFCKEKRRKKKMPQFDKSELDQWAAQMNAEFEEAERFNLLVE